MSIQKYKIIRWDPIMFTTTLVPTQIPAIFIEVDKNLLDFAKENNNVLLIVIKDTNSVYDNKKIISTFALSSDITGCKDNILSEKGLYVLKLNTQWYGYPSDLGNCEIYGLKGGVTVDKINNIELKEPKLSLRELKKEDCPKCGMNNYTIYVILFGIIVILSSVIYIQLNRK